MQPFFSLTVEKTTCNVSYLTPPRYSRIAKQKRLETRTKGTKFNSNDKKRPGRLFSLWQSQLTCAQENASRP